MAIDMMLLLYVPFLKMRGFVQVNVNHYYINVGVYTLHIQILQQCYLSRPEPWAIFVCRHVMAIFKNSMC